MSLFATKDDPTFSSKYDSDSNDLPTNSYGIQYDKDMYLANDRYSCFIDKKIEINKIRYNRKMTPEEHEIYERTGYAPGEIRPRHKSLDNNDD